MRKTAVTVRLDGKTVLREEARVRKPAGLLVQELYIPDHESLVVPDEVLNPTVQSCICGAFCR